MQSFAMRAWVGAVALFLLLFVAAPFVVVPTAQGQNETEMVFVQQSLLQEDQSFCDALLWPDQDDQCGSAKINIQNTVTHNFLDTDSFLSRLHVNLKERKFMKSVL